MDSDPKPQKSTNFELADEESRTRGHSYPQKAANLITFHLSYFKFLVHLVF